MTLFVSFIAPSALEMKEEPKRPPPPKPEPIEKPQPRQIAAETPIVTPTDDIVPPPPPKPEPPAPAPTIQAPPAPMPTGPVSLSTELAVVCPNRIAPNYPAISRRLDEAGTVVLHVELDETGLVAAARVQAGSGYPRLDAAALSAVKTWRCTPAMRDGQPVRAVALQPFKFVLQGY